MMSANNAIFVIPTTWLYAGHIKDGVVVEWKTKDNWFIFEGDYDKVQELIQEGIVLKEFLWYAAQQGAVLSESHARALVLAERLSFRTPSLEYGIRFKEPLHYEEAF